MHLFKLNKFPISFNPKHIKMKFQLFTLLKSIQIIIIVIILWRVFSQLEICGRFLQTKAILRYGIDGTCQQLFFYLPPNPNENLNESSSIRLPCLRLWWSYDAQNFLPPKPDKQELNQITELIKEQMVESAKLVDSENIRIVREMNSGDEGEDEMRTEFSRMKMKAILPEEEEQPEELLELDKYARESEEEATNSNDSESILVKMGKIEKGMPKKREKREMDDELPWLKMKKSAILPHEEMKYSNQENRQKDESQNWQNIDDKFYCFELLNMQEYAMDPENRGWASPLVILGNRSVATIAIGFSHLLLLFAQVYLLNCLEVDNLEQRRGKLFLELLIILISFLGWLVIVLLKIRTELNWEMMWMCTNFRPEIFKMIVFVQIFASTLMLLALFEGLYIFTKMRKCSKMIKIERENDLKPQRPSI